MPTAHSSDLTAGLATEPPVNRPRSASVSRVIGFTLTKACSQPGIVAVGASRLLPNTSGKNAMNPKACTPCAVLRLLVPDSPLVHRGVLRGEADELPDLVGVA